MGDEAAVLRLAETARSSFGGTDVLVNNAAIYPSHPWHEADAAEWDRVMAVNVRGAFLLAQAVRPQMLERGGGSIVNIASVTFYEGTALLLSYVASKGAVIGFTRALAREAGPEGIRVNAVAPGRLPDRRDRLLGGSGGALGRRPRGAVHQAPGPTRGRRGRRLLLRLGPLLLRHGSDPARGRRLDARLTVPPNQGAPDVVFSLRPRGGHHRRVRRHRRGHGARPGRGGLRRGPRRAARRPARGARRAGRAGRRPGARRARGRGRPRGRPRFPSARERRAWLARRPRQQRRGDAPRPVRGPGSRGVAEHGGRERLWPAALHPGGHAHHARAGLGPHRERLVGGRALRRRPERGLQLHEVGRDGLLRGAAPGGPRGGHPGHLPRARLRGDRAARGAERRGPRRSRSRCATPWSRC